MFFFAFSFAPLRLCGYTLNTIPVLNLQPEIDELWDELNAAVQSVLRSGAFIMGPAVREFEAAAARYLGVPHAIGVNSGTDALLIGLRALDIGPGDEVITTPFTFFATVEAILHLGAVPVFADIDPRTFNLDPERVAEKITPRTRAILPVHLYGQAADMAPILDLARAHGLHVVEDVAQAFGGEYRGRKLGTLGAIGAFSFFPSKILGACGDAGLIATADDGLAQRCRMLRVHGARKKYENECLGWNSRLDTLQAAILNVKLAHVERFIDGRRAAAARYDEWLRDVPGLIVPYNAPDLRHVYHQYTVRLPNGCRDGIQRRLQEQGIGTMVYYPIPVHRLPLFGDRCPPLPISETLSTEVLSLPIWPQITPAVQQTVVAGMRQILRDR